MAPSREDSQGSAGKMVRWQQWHHQSSVVLTSFNIEPQPRRNPTRWSSLSLLGWSRGCQPCCRATTAWSQVGDIPTPTRCTVAIGPSATPEDLPLAPWCTLPWEHGCTERLLLSPLGSLLPAHPDRNQPWLQGFHSRVQKTQWRASHNHLSSPCRLCKAI